MRRAIITFLIFGAVLLASMVPSEGGCYEKGRLCENIPPPHDCCSALRCRRPLGCSTCPKKCLDPPI